MRRPTLRRRLSVLSAAVVAVAVVGVSLIAGLSLRGQLRDHVDHSLDRIAPVVQADLEQLVPLPPHSIHADTATLVQAVSPNGTTHHASFQVESLPVTAADLDVAQGKRARARYDTTVNGQPYRVLTVASQRGGAVQVARDLTEVSSTLEGFSLQLAGVDVAAIAAAAALGYVLTRAGLRPVDRIAQATEHVASTQDLHAAVDTEPNDPDEVARFASSVNKMLEALAAARQAQRQLVEDASHELATPLTSLRTNVDLLLHAEGHPERRLAPADRLRLLVDVQAQMHELDHLIEEVVELARDPSTTEEVVALDLADVVRAAIGRARTRTPEISFQLKEEKVCVRGRRSALERAVLNLLDNAAKWGPPDHPVEVRVQRADEGAEIVVADRGPGIPDADLDLVFERFHRATEARSMPGSGLGLAIVRQIVQAHGGRAWAGHRHGGGTEAWILLPLSDALTAASC